MKQTHPTQPVGLDALEARTLFSTYLYQGLVDSLDLGRAVIEVAGPEGAEGFGAAVAGLGDINGDGHADFAVAAPGDTSGAPDGTAGSVFIYSGVDGSLIRTLTDGAAGFGVALANIGDFNNDGVPDLLVGSPWHDDSDDDVHNPTGAAYIFSGADGLVLHTIMGTDAFGEFGRVVALAADLNADDRPEFVIGAPAGGAAGAGQVLVFSGADAALLHTLDGTEEGERFGAAIGATTAAPDENEPAIVVGAPEWMNATGRVYVFGADGSLLQTLAGVEEGEQFGTSVALAQRRTFEGVAEFAIFVGAPGADDYRGQFGNDVAEDRGRIDHFQFMQSEAFNQFLGGGANARLGATLHVVGSLSADGTDDLIATAPGDPTDTVRYLISASGTNWHMRQGTAINFYLNPVDVLQGGAFAAAGDVDNDGFGDVITATTADGGRVTIVSSLALGHDITVDGATPDLSHIWAHTGDQLIIFIDGVATPYERIPGLTPLPPSDDIETPYSRVQAILNDGTIIFYNEPRSGEGRTELMFLREGVATPLSELVMSVSGTDDEPDYDAMRVGVVGSTGHVALTDAAGRVWVFRDGVLHFAWNGTVADINSAGSIVGTRGMNAEPVVWTPDDGVTVLDGIERPGAINDMGQVVGVVVGTGTATNPGSIGVWQDGDVTLISAGPEIDNFSGSIVTWHFRDFDNAGRIIGDVNIPGIRTANSTRVTYLFEPDDGLRALGEAAYGLPTDIWNASYTFMPSAPFVPPIFFGPDGSIFAYEARLTQISDDAPFKLREDAPIANLGAQGFDYVLGVNVYGDVVVLSNSGDTWTGRRLTGGIRPGDTIGLALVADPQDNNTPYAIVGTENALLSFRLVELPGVSARGAIKGFPEQTAIVQGLTVFTNAVGVVHIAGIDANGDVVIYFRSTDLSFSSPLGWTYDNLTRTHLDAQDLETPQFIGTLTAFATPWLGMNINGVDTSGHVHSVWWAPGQVLWTVTDLTEAAQSVITFNPEITSFATPWGTLHINGIDENGQLAALWWAPGFGGNWRHDVLIEDGIELVAGSLVSYTTPWGGLNIAGRDANNKVVVYWWSPESNVWADERLSFRDDAASPDLAGRLSAHVSAEGEMAIAARGADDSAYRFSWRPGDANLWTLEDLTDLAG